MPKLAAFAAVSALSLGLTCAEANTWGVVGAGNATCSHWGQMNAVHRQEVLSWMAGFATAMNVESAASGKHEYRLELLTYKYLERSTNQLCARADGGSQSMLSVLLEILQELSRG